MFVSITGTLLTYLASVIIFRNYLNVSFILEEFAWLYIFVLTIISWIPFYVSKRLKQCISPDQIEQIKKFGNKSITNIKKEDDSGLQTRLIY